LTSTDLRLLVGCAIMAAVCITAWRLGDRPQRGIAAVIAICWVLTTVAEFATGRTAEPVMVGDAVFGIGLLWFVWRYNTVWLWIMIGMEAALFFLHATIYQVGRPPNPLQTVGNNLLATLGLVVLLGAVLRGHFVRRRAQRASAAS
jgi:hypothetical protein